MSEVRRPTWLRSVVFAARADRVIAQMLLSLDPHYAHMRLVFPLHHDRNRYVTTATKRRPDARAELA
jgi:hypothetical protein